MKITRNVKGDIHDGKQKNQESIQEQAYSRRSGSPSQTGIRKQRGPAVRSIPDARRFPQYRPLSVYQGVSLAPPSRHRDDHVRAQGRRGARRQHGQQGRYHVGRHAVDDRGKWHHPPGDAAGRRQRGHGGISALGQPPKSRQDDGHPGTAISKARRCRKL